MAIERADVAINSVVKNLDGALMERSISTPPQSDHVNQAEP